MGLHDYQAEALKLVKEKLKQHGRAILVAPCASGKTIMFSHLCLEYSLAGQQSMIIVHRDELVQQTLDKLQMVGFNRSQLAVEKGEERVGYEADVVVASLQSLYRNPRDTNSRMTHLVEHLPRLGLVVYDECHHARAQATYDMLLYLMSLHPEAKLLGASATPYRADVLELDEVFGEPEETWTVIQREELVMNGYLAPLKHTYLDVLSESDVEQLKIMAGDYDINALSTLINTEKVTPIIADAVLSRRDVPGVVYACTIPHGEILLEAVRARGVSTALLTGSTPPEERRDIIQKFGKEIMCIINVMVLTEGYDAPTMRYLILARPTRSAVLYEQVTGRAARTAPGKEFGEIIHLTSIRTEKRIASERKKKEQRTRRRTEQTGERLAKAIIRDQYVGVMLQKCAQLDPDGLLALARNFSALCQKKILWLPLTGQGPLFTVIPFQCGNRYDRIGNNYIYYGYEAYKDAIFAIAGPGKKNRTVILACHAAKDYGPWTVQDGHFVHIEARIAEATHRFYDWVCEISPFAKDWMDGIVDIPDTDYGRKSGRLNEIDLSKLYSHSAIDDEHYEYIIDMSAAAEGYYKSLLKGNLLIKQTWQAAS